MKKSLAILLAALAFTGLLFVSCNNKPDTDNTQQVDPDDLEALQRSVPVTNNWVYDKRPDITVHVENPNSVNVQAKVKLRITSDIHESVGSFEKEVEIPANGELDVHMSTDSDLAPGFYQAEAFVNGKSAKNFHFGLSPFQIVSAPDSQADFDKFWDDAVKQLSAIEINADLFQISSNSNYTVYFVEMQSIPDGLTGEPVTVRGYYLEPNDGKKHPVLMHFQGYDTLSARPSITLPGGSGEFAEFYLSHRGQYLNRSTQAERERVFGKNDGKGDFQNIYNDWFAFSFGNKDGYYYRGAFMDCVRAVQFMATRPTSDMNNLFAEGSSQGGALSYAAAALSPIPFTAIAPNVAFLGDYPDYFRIVSWPGDVAKANKGSMTDDQMYAFLSYFDTKNLATKITCPVYATIGLQDRTCPPHTNIAPFNNLPGTDKQMTFYPQMQHSYPPSWTSDIAAFFKSKMK